MIRRPAFAILEPVIWLVCMAISFAVAAALWWFLGGYFILGTIGAWVGGITIMIVVSFLADRLLGKS
jgi:hypothetical protein